MKYKEKKLVRHVVLVYGFEPGDERVYKMVLTLQRTSRTYARIHGLLSKGTMALDDFLKLWKFLKEICSARIFEFEVFPEHSRVYKAVMEIGKVIKTKTFDGYECEILQMHRDAKPKLNLKTTGNA